MFWYLLTRNLKWRLVTQLLGLGLLRRQGHPQPLRGRFPLACLISPTNFFPPGKFRGPQNPRGGKNGGHVFSLPVGDAFVRRCFAPHKPFLDAGFKADTEEPDRAVCPPLIVRRSVFASGACFKADSVFFPPFVRRDRPAFIALSAVSAVEIGSPGWFRKSGSTADKVSCPPFVRRVRRCSRKPVNVGWKPVQVLFS